MIALCALTAIFLWALFGFALWRLLIQRHVRSTILKVCLTLLFAVVWFIGPVLDEILGAREFDQLCREMPPVKFYGPVAVGPGVFFDEHGRPKWKNSDEFSAIVRKTDGFNKFIGDHDEWRTIRKWPMPIVELHTIYFERTTGKNVLESFARYSKGGWLRRLIGLGDYQCPHKERYPHDEEWIVFK